ncbi:hypothetical protein QCMSULEJ_CDS0078 [Escherichia phage KS_W4]|uniref:hypothetical protein n=1 Tax=Escherichia coli TaxID=562 RepID=UPI001B9756F9|nr:hypothetical protein [Escherichia coli]UPT52942.1 hypothetical protein [Hafnia phage yong3]UPT53032.1 hypothetical protein [Hafnia phage yong3]HBC8488043.1 hypothetical protein [Escherichia coli]
MSIRNVICVMVANNNFGFVEGAEYKMDLKTRCIIKGEEEWRAVVEDRGDIYIYSSDTMKTIAVFEFN